MRQRFALLFFVPLILAFMCQPAAVQSIAVQPVAEDPEAYTVISALLPGEGQFLVLRQQTTFWEKKTSKDLGIRGDAKFRKEWGKVMDDFVRKNRSPRLLDDKIALERSYKIVSDSELDAIFEHRDADGWNAFYKKYPRSFGIWSVSAVGFNADKTKALVELNRNCGLLCGGGGPHFLEKRDGRWVEVRVNATVRVWAS
jgi:hypothetical protein